MANAEEFDSKTFWRAEAVERIKQLQTPNRRRKLKSIAATREKMRRAVHAYGSAIRPEDYYLHDAARLRLLKEDKWVLRNILLNARLERLMHQQGEDIAYAGLEVTTGLWRNEEHIIF